MSITQVPLRPLKRGSLAKLWLGRLLGGLGPVEDRHVLPSEHERGGLMALLHHHPPRLCDLVRVAGPDHVEPGHRP